MGMKGEMKKEKIIEKKNKKRDVGQGPASLKDDLLWLDIYLIFVWKDTLYCVREDNI